MVHRGGTEIKFAQYQSRKLSLTVSDTEVNYYSLYWSFQLETGESFA